MLALISGMKDLWISEDGPEESRGMMFNDARAKTDFSPLFYFIGRFLRPKRRHQQRSFHVHTPNTNPLTRASTSIQRQYYVTSTSCHLPKVEVGPSVFGVVCTFFLQHFSFYLLCVLPTISLKPTNSACFHLIPPTNTSTFAHNTLQLFAAITSQPLSDFHLIYSLTSSLSSQLSSPQ